MGEGFDFGEALVGLKAGGKLQRAGWNGKGMFIVLMRGYPDGVPANQNMSSATGVPVGTVVKMLPYLMMMMKTATNEFVPWLASQTDILAEDCSVVA